MQPRLTYDEWTADELKDERRALREQMRQLTEQGDKYANAGLTKLCEAVDKKRDALEEEFHELNKYVNKKR